MDISQDYPNLSGLELLRAMMAAGRRPPIMETLDFELVEIQEGRAVFAEGKLYDAQRKLLASATSTLMVFDKRKEK